MQPSSSDNSATCKNSQENLQQASTSRDKGETSIGSTWTRAAISSLPVDFLENQTDERQPEPGDLPNPDDAILRQASVPPGGHWAQPPEPPDLHQAGPSGGVDPPTAAGTGPTPDEVLSYLTSVQEQQPPVEQPGLPNPDDHLIEQAWSAEAIRAEPEEVSECICLSIEGGPHRVEGCGCCHPSDCNCNRLSNSPVLSHCNRRRRIAEPADGVKKRFGGEK